MIELEASLVVASIFGEDGVAVWSQWPWYQEVTAAHLESIIEIKAAQVRGRRR